MHDHRHPSSGRRLRTALVPFTTLALLAAPSATFAAPPKPAAEAHDLLPLAAVPRVDMPGLDYVALDVEDAGREEAGLPPRYAVPNAVAITPDAHGLWEPTPDGRLVWRLRVSSPNAVSLNFGFTRFALPRDGHLFVMSADGRTALRPFTAADNETHGELWTPPLPGNDAIIEVSVPAGQRNALDLEIGAINQGYRGFHEFFPLSGSCNVDTICPEGDGWRDEIAAVGVISTGGSTFCTGFMVNNTAQDLTPFFMTANHCGINSGNAASLVVIWNYENSVCRAPGSGASGSAGDGVQTDFQSGSFFRASSAASDFVLVELDDDPDPAWLVAYAGWDATGADATNAIGIHHPNTDEKRISFEDQPTTTTSYLGTGVPGDGSHVRVTDWDVGTTEPGSSGSPLFNQDHRVIGQLHGGFAACGNNDSDWYGKFSVSWNGGSSSSRLVDWLDPIGTGALVVDTISGAGLQVAPAGDVSHVGLVGGPFTDPTFAYTLTNPSSTPVSWSVALGGGSAPLLLDGGAGPVTGTLAAFGGTATVTVALDDPAALPAGVYPRDVIFSDLTNGNVATRTHVIEIGQVGFSTTPDTGLVSGGPVGGPFPGTAVYTLTSTQPTPVTVEVAASAPWIALDGGTGPVTVNLNGLGASATVTVGFSSDANLLPAGLANGTVSFTSLSGGDDDTSRPVTLDVGRFTYVADEVPLGVPDNGAVTSTITVGDVYCVADVDVEITIDHTYVGDLCVELAHDGTVVGLIQRLGASEADPCHAGTPFGCSASDLDVTLDDAAAQAIEGQCSSGLTGTFAPNESLSALAGSFANGNWTLTVRDRANGDTGTLVAWTLKVATAGGTCPPIAQDVSVQTEVGTPVNVTLVASSGGGHDTVIESLPAHGVLADPNAGAIAATPYTLAASGDVVTYTPAGGYSGTDGFTFSADDGLPSNVATVDIQVGGPQLVYDFPLDVDPGWSRTGQWDFGVPAGNDGDPSAGVTGANVLGYNLAGDYPNGLAEQFLTSDALDLTGVTGVEVRFWRQLGVEHATYDHARFQVSTDGAGWTTVWENQAGSSNTLNELSWSQHAYDVSALADDQATVFLRWVMGTTDGSVTFQGWNLDDIEVHGVVETTPCPWDVATPADGQVGFADLNALLANWGACPPGPCPWDIGDAGPDGQVGFADLNALLSRWGPCP